MPEKKLPFKIKVEKAERDPNDRDIFDSTESDLVPETSTEEKKPFYKKWWFWVIVGLIVIITILEIPVGGKRSDETTSSTTTVTETTTTTTTMRTYTMDELVVKLDKSDGNWYAYAGDEKAMTYTGLAKNEFGLWYVVNGKVDLTRNGTETIDGKTYVISDGKAQEQETRTQRVTDSSGVSIEMKEFMDSYEDFVDEYVEFMENYDSDNAWAVLGKSSAMLAKYSDWAEKLENLNEDDWSAKDWAYYEEVSLRCASKLSKVAYSMY